ncbi:acetate--CoA ligase family protein [Chloroflexota bacterium]
MNGDKLKQFEPIFYPGSIAVVGTSTDETKAGTRFLKALLRVDFKGKVFSVNHSSGVVLGLQSYPKLSSIPDPVDYVIISVPANNILEVLDDCGQKGVKAVHIFTAGFKEGDTDESRHLEMKLVEKAKSGGFRIIGPNCIGVCNPSINMPYGMVTEPIKSGPVAIVSQSGGVAEKTVTAGMARGLRFSKVVSFGNGCDLDSVDYLEYFHADPETKFIGVYLEGVRDGRRLFELLKKISKTKPVVVCKGGKTQAGARAATSHTGSLASSHDIWSSALKQIGAIEVGGYTEFVDTLLALQQLQHFEGRNAAIVSGFTDGGGGDGVIATDFCIGTGFNVPNFSTETIEQLQSVLPLRGSILHNPLDVSQSGGRMERIEKSLRLAAADSNIDFLLIHAHIDQFDIFLSPDVAVALIDFLIELGSKDSKPAVILLPPGLTEVKRLSVEQRFLEAGVLTYPSPERAVRALMNVSRYFRNRTEASG